MTRVSWRRRPDLCENTRRMEARLTEVLASHGAELRAVRPLHGGACQENFKIDVDSDGIALITFDVPGRSMNTITASVVRDLYEIVDKIKTDAAIKGAVITSGKEGFSAGADLSMLAGMGAEYARIGREQGEEAAMKAFDEP